MGLQAGTAKMGWEPWGSECGRQMGAGAGKVWTLYLPAGGMFEAGYKRKEESGTGLRCLALKEPDCCH